MAPRSISLLTAVLASCAIGAWTRAESAPVTTEVLASAATRPIRQESCEYYLGDTKITIIKHSKDGPCKLTFFHPHGDEEISLEAALDVIRRNGGRVLEIKNGDRDLTFSTGGKRFLIDPNRLFTEEGIKKDLRDKDLHDKNGDPIHDPAATAVAAVEKFSTQLLKLLTDASGKLFWIGVHNNRPGHLTVNNILPHAKPAEIFRNPSLPANDFFLTTRESDFEKLKGAHYNVALQNYDTVDKDGSLSVYCQGKDVHIPYFTVEAGRAHDRLDPEIRMIEALVTLAGSAPLPGPLVDPPHPKKDRQSGGN